MARDLVKHAFALLDEHSPFLGAKENAIAAQKGRGY